ncbi:MAG: type 1 glutamine amidotransferase [Nitrospirales bacterium]|nr:type 1 glutamine amidotransferase [Nitrospirales bacterium]
MAGKKLEGMKVAILVADYFEQVEMTEPKKALDEAGAITKIVAPKPGRVTGFKHDTKGDAFTVDATLEEANPDDFDAVLLPGGALNADKLRMDPRAREFVRRTDEQDKPIAVICHAPWLLVSAGLAKGRTLTSYYTIQDDIRNAGGHWVNKEAVRDQNWVSSRQPGDIPAFNQAMTGLFAEHAARLQPVG